MIYTLTLSPCLDYVMEVPELRFGRVNRAANAHLRPGGKGLNVSILLSRFGIPNLALGFAAGFTGIEMERMLREEGCQTAFIRLPEGISRINVKIEGAQAAEINAEGPPVPDEACEELMERLRELEDGDTLVLAGNIPKSLPQDLYEQILRRTDGRALRSVVDTTGEALQMALAHRPFLIKPNHLELGELFGVDVDRPDEVEPYARRLQDMGARNVLVSMAERGALLLDETGKVHRALPPQGQVRSAVGSGDSMVAGFLAGFERTGDYTLALKLGIAAGSATAFSPWLAEVRDIRALLERPEAFGL